MANELATSQNINITIYTWASPENLDWGPWNDKVKIRFIPYSRYFQEFIGQVFYYFWSRIDNPDTILVNFMYHGETVLSKNMNIIYVLHSPASLIPHRYKYIRDHVTKFNKLSFIAVSEFVKKDAMVFIDSDRISVIHHGIDFKQFHQNVNYQNNGKIKILTIAALEKWKGIQHIIQVLSDKDLINEFEYFIIGDGPYKQELQDLIDKLNLSLNVHFLGSKDRIESLLPNYDIYCNLSDGEAFGLSLIEAMACGLPAIIYDIPPFDSLIPSHTAKKVKNKSQTILKEYLIDLADKNERERIGKNGRNYVRENYSVEKMASNYYSLFFGCD